MSGIPARYPANGSDTAVSITRAVTHHRVGMRLAFEPGTLDPDLLGRATRLMLDAEPLLGCAFCTDSTRAYWARLPSLDETACFSAVDTGDPDADMDAFQAQEVPDSGPQISVVLFRGGDQDHLGIKVSHVLADGQAAKQCAYLLAETYSRLADDPDYEPQPDLAKRPTGKDVWAGLTPEQRRQARRAKSWVNPTWVVPSKGSSGGGLTFRTAFLEPDSFVRLKRYGAERGATVNDMMLTAIFRACAGMFDPPAGKPLSLMCTADLRRYLPESAPLPPANISISGSLGIERVDGEEFGGTLSRVRQSMDAWAAQCYGAGPLFNAERLAGLSYRVVKALLGLTFRMAGGSGKTYPWFTNIGVLDETSLTFAGAAPLSAHMFGPASIGAGIVPVVSTYRNRLAVTMGFCREDMDASIVQDVLLSTVSEIEAAVRVAEIDGAVA